MPSVRSNLRDRLQRGETIVAPGAYDPLSARVVQALGFAAVYTGGYMTGAHTSITEPLLTLTEQVEVAQKVAHAVDLPVITDAGAGYGDPLHVMRCVREFEAAGIAGIHIEDQVYPKRASYHKGLEHIVPMPEFVERMTYALKARRDPDFLIIGRTDAFSAVEGSRAELIQRGLTLKELGVDAVMPRGVRAREDLAFFRKEVPGVSLMVIAGADDISVQEYAELVGIRIIREYWWVIAKDESSFPRLTFGDGPSDYRPPRWPDPDHPQQLHLDIPVYNPEAAEELALGLGATRLQDKGEYRSYADPAGHPFCLYRDTA